MFLAIAKGFGFESTIVEVVEKNFPAQKEWIGIAFDFSKNLIETSGDGIVTGLGLVILLWTVMRVLDSIEIAFNDIWKIREQRPIIRKLSDYISILIIIPVLIFVGSGIDAFISKNIYSMNADVRYLFVIKKILIYLLSVVPNILIFVTFSLLYAIIPNTKVKAKSSIIAGIIAGTFYMLLQYAYLKLQIGVVRYNLIYGGFALVPLFLIWVRMSWLITLFGAEISYALENLKFNDDADKYKLNFYNKKILYILILKSIVQRFERGEKPFGIREIAFELKIPKELIKESIRDMLSAKVISKIVRSDKEGHAFQPAKDIEKVTVKYLVENIERAGESFDVEKFKNSEIDKIKELLKSLEREFDCSSYNLLLKEL